MLLTTGQLKVFVFFAVNFVTLFKFDKECEECNILVTFWADTTLQFCFCPLKYMSKSRLGIRNTSFITWQIPGKYLATTWQLRGNYLATTWQILGKLLANTWQSGDRQTDFFTLGFDSGVKAESRDVNVEVLVGQQPDQSETVAVSRNRHFLSKIKKNLSIKIV
jgi:hypothetical protein